MTLLLIGLSILMTGVLFSQGSVVIFEEGFDDNFRLGTWNVTLAGTANLGVEDSICLTLLLRSPSLHGRASRAITPSIGPILTGTVLEFAYRTSNWRHQALSKSDEIVQIRVGNSVLYTLSSRNYVYTENDGWNNITISLNNFVGQHINIQFFVPSIKEGEDLRFLLDNVRIHVPAQHRRPISSHIALPYEENFNTDDFLNKWTLDNMWWTAYHGIGYSGTLYAFLGSTYWRLSSSDSRAFTPLLGPIVTGTALKFSYNVEDVYFQPIHIGEGSVQIKVGDAVLFTIDKSNHNPSVNAGWNEVTICLSNFVGQYINIEFFVPVSRSDDTLKWFLLDDFRVATP
jgi:hypothetical protein